MAVRSSAATRLTTTLSTSQPRASYARWALRASDRTDSADWSLPPTTAITDAPNSFASRALSDSSSGSWVAAKSVPRTRTTSYSRATRWKRSTRRDTSSSVPCSAWSAVASW